MANTTPTRQELYDRIKASTKDAVILEEMQKLGFWKKNEGVPDLPGQLITKEAALVQELRGLLEKQRKYENKEQALKEVRKARLEESKLKQAENKKLRKQKREENAARWKKQKEKDILYLGEDVSAGLNHKDSDKEKLVSLTLPVIQNAEELAKEMGLSVGELRFLSYHRTVSKTNHYKRFYIPKKTGGKRLISTPMPRLKKAQYWILKSILNNITINTAAHGFVKTKSIVTNATPHIQSDVVINIDLKDFFPSVTYKRVKGVFRRYGYSEQVSTILALICTEPDCDQIELDGENYFVAGTERFLPQGAPTSPAITNILCRRLDARLKGLAQKLNFTFTRYADDLTFSGSGIAADNVKTLLNTIRKIIREENFIIHPDKVRVLRKGARKEVTGIVVNEKPSVKAKDLDRFRALLFQIEKDGIQGKHWNNSTNLLASIKGYANFVNMVDPVKGKPLLERVTNILETHQFKHEIKNKSKAMLAKEAAMKQAEEANKKKKPWWKIW